MKDWAVSDWLVAALVWVLLFGGAYALAGEPQRPAPAPKAAASVEIATNGEYPVDVVTIRRSMSPRARVCVEPLSDAQRVMCVSVGEFRDWMAKRTTAK